MPAISPNELIDNIIDAIQNSGATGTYISKNLRTHPREFLINQYDTTFSVWVYIWTLTHGGRSSLPNEYRIQMTSVNSPLSINPNGYTVLMGYHPDLKIFAGFDLEKHKQFTVGSPSVQINISTLENALQNGLSFSTKENDEIVVGVRPDQFMTYCINSKELHLYGSEIKLTNLLNKAVELENIEEDDLSELSIERKRIVENISRLSRDANFRKKVLSAYENRCAITRIQLKLVDAAHILPVSSEDSNDSITNGLALSPTFHRAYDNCLIFLDENYVMRLNDNKFNELSNISLDSGIEQLNKYLNKKIHLPYDVQQRPKKELIKLANKYRRIPGYE